MANGITKISLNISKDLNKAIDTHRVDYMNMDITISKSEYIKIAIKDKIQKDIKSKK